MNEPLRKEILLARRDHEAVDDDVIDEVCSHRGRISEITHLHWRRAMGRYGRTRLMGIALEIDENVDMVGMDPSCRLAMGRGADRLDSGAAMRTGGTRTTSPAASRLSAPTRPLFTRTSPVRSIR